ncbi:MAG: hypothetical protein Q8922_09830 [Bacteroidota bacterium]|nr:hypothetical protein [Bacteroidota bacterium]MDP4232854.1 hypothetical protein [Bacteroidota bacterium]MDP4241898.1 hypothetical protein [Bacteroidota bacterium]MDP4288223.1 hypothetical protein [Bacteroidota bacterium]
MAFVAGCEQVVPADGLPYVDQIVIKGILVAGEPIDSISITHTLPLNVTYTPTAAAIPDAIVMIMVDGKEIPLSYLGQGDFGDPMNDTVQAGKTYSIDVRWNGLHATASTLVPSSLTIQDAMILPPQFDTQYFLINGYTPDTFVSVSATASVSIDSKTNEVYRVIADSVWNDSSYHSSSSDYYRSYQDYTLPNDTSSERLISLTYSFYLSRMDTNGFAAKLTIAGYDRAYYDFLRTYEHYDNGGDIFGSSGTNPKWNVSGDGIGIFIGEAKTQVSMTYRR